MYIYIILDIHDIPPTSIPQKFKKEAKMTRVVVPCMNPQGYHVTTDTKMNFFVKVIYMDPM